MIIDRVLIITFVSNSLSFEKNYVVRQRNDDSFENFWRNWSIHVSKIFLYRVKEDLKSSALK